MSEHLFLPITGVTSVSCKIDPVVVFTILDHFNRRNETQYRVVGTLLGSKLDSNFFEVKTCFVVPHIEDEDEENEEGENKSTINLSYHRNMLDLHLKANPSEIVVGWFTTGNNIDENLIRIHEQYIQEIPSPIVLTVDIELRNSKLDVQPYIVIPFGDSNAPSAYQFQPISYELDIADAEPGCYTTLFKAKESENLTTALENDADTLTSSLNNLLEVINTITSYVDDVVAGKKPADKKIGRVLANSLNSLPHINPSEFDRLFSTSLQDKLTAVYLANLTRTQLALAEKLQTSL